MQGALRLWFYEEIRERGRRRWVRRARSALCERASPRFWILDAGFGSQRMPHSHKHLTKLPHRFQRYRNAHWGLVERTLLTNESRRSGRAATSLGRKRTAPAGGELPENAGALTSAMSSGYHVALTTTWRRAAKPCVGLQPCRSDRADRSRDSSRRRDHRRSTSSTGG